jgi:hypothetical protein
MSILINSGYVSLIHAKNAWEDSKKSDPKLVEAHIRKTCFELQQCMEFFIKGLIELKGNPYIPQHPLQLNTNVLRNLITKGIYFYDCEYLIEILDSIDLSASKFNMWEASTRYLNTFATTKNEIENAFVLCDKLQNYCNNEVQCR